jgi:hypothetical protein
VYTNKKSIEKIIIRVILHIGVTITFIPKGFYMKYLSILLLTSMAFCAHAMENEPNALSPSTQVEPTHTRDIAEIKQILEGHCMEVIYDVSNPTINESEGKKCADLILYLTDRAKEENNQELLAYVNNYVQMKEKKFVTQTGETNNTPCTKSCKHECNQSATTEDTMNDDQQ